MINAYFILSIILSVAEGMDSLLVYKNLHNKFGPIPMITQYTVTMTIHRSHFLPSLVVEWEGGELEGREL